MPARLYFRLLAHRLYGQLPWVWVYRRFRMYRFGRRYGRMTRRDALRWVCSD